MTSVGRFYAAEPGTGPLWGLVLGCRIPASLCETPKPGPTRGSRQAPIRRLHADRDSPHPPRGWRWVPRCHPAGRGENLRSNASMVSGGFKTFKTYWSFLTHLNTHYVFFGVFPHLHPWRAAGGVGISIQSALTPSLPTPQTAPAGPERRDKPLRQQVIGRDTTLQTPPFGGVPHLLRPYRQYGVYPKFKPQFPGRITPLRQHTPEASHTGRHTGSQRGRQDRG
ncbi:MAG: hypothetical protein CM15mP103_06230 [Gammaproteobacteria bacterium]|nr:MAG: hypothetical protein CM15mP103_06230 [Gammaproteobacteria bacterium]